MKSEIKVASVHLETPLIISDEFVQLLIVESPDEFFAMVSDLDKQPDGEEGVFAFSRNGELIAPSKFGTMIADVFHFGVTDKKIVNLLYKKLENISYNEKPDYYYDLVSKTVGFMEELSYCVPFALEYGEPAPSDFFKITGLKFEENYDSIEEKIICYINALIELKNCEFFVFVNLKSVLSDERLQRVYDHCRSEQVGLLLVESCKQRATLPCEKAVIITEDLCEILENYEDLC